MREIKREKESKWEVGGVRVSERVRCGAFFHSFIHSFFCWFVYHLTVVELGIKEGGWEGE